MSVTRLPITRCVLNFREVCDPNVGSRLIQTCSSDSHKQALTAVCAVRARAARPLVLLLGGGLLRPSRLLAVRGLLRPRGLLQVCRLFRVCGLLRARGLVRVCGLVWACGLVCVCGLVQTRGLFWWFGLVLVCGLVQPRAQVGGGVPQARGGVAQVAGHALLSGDTLALHVVVVL